MILDPLGSGDTAKFVKKKSQCRRFTSYRAWSLAWTAHSQRAVVLSAKHGVGPAQATEALMTYQDLIQGMLLDTPWDELSLFHLGAMSLWKHTDLLVVDNIPLVRSVVRRGWLGAVEDELDPYAGAAAGAPGLLSFPAYNSALSCKTCGFKGWTMAKCPICKPDQLGAAAARKVLHEQRRQ